MTNPQYVVTELSSGSVYVTSVPTQAHQFWFDAPSQKLMFPKKPLATANADTAQWLGLQYPTSCAFGSTFQCRYLQSDPNALQIQMSTGVLQFPTLGSNAQLVVGAPAPGDLAYTVLSTDQSWSQNGGCLCQPFIPSANFYIQNIQILASASSAGVGQYGTVSVYQGLPADVAAGSATLISSAINDATNGQIVNFTQWNPSVQVTAGVQYTWVLKDPSSSCVVEMAFSLGSKPTNTSWTLGDGVMLRPGQVLPMVSGKAIAHAMYTTSTDPKLIPFGIVCSSASFPQLYSQFVLSPIQSLLDYMATILTPMDQSDPTYQLCIGSGAMDSQNCYYNHAPGSSLPTFPDINSDPNTYFGFAVSSSGANETIYLGPPNDSFGLNNGQLSMCWQCGCPGMQPATCAQNPDSYCHCTANGKDVICGLSCVAGTSQYPKGKCYYDPLNFWWIQQYQCFPSQIYGVTNPTTGAKTCISYLGPNPPPGGQLFSSMQACQTNWADCPPGYKRNLGDPSHPGCYLDGSNMIRGWTACPNLSATCDANSTNCGYDGKTNWWTAYSHGSCVFGDCNNDCYYAGTIPPWGYYCAQNGMTWLQNQSDNTVSSPGKVNGWSNDNSFNVANEQYCTATSPYGVYTVPT